jgi:hypothetical protein
MSPQAANHFDNHCIMSSHRKETWLLPHAFLVLSFAPNAEKRLPRGGIG